MRVLLIYNDGLVDSFGNSVSVDDFLAVRPALWYDLGS